MITIKQLNYALAVDKPRHFKQAAERCSISQSALSTAILELREPAQDEVLMKLFRQQLSQA